MPKTTGTPGGAYPRVQSVEIYDKIKKYLLKQYDPMKDLSLSAKQKKNFLKQANKFVVHSDGKDGGWPHGDQLYISRRYHTHSVKVTYLLE